jgi:hypothetical protein
MSIEVTSRAGWGNGSKWYFAEEKRRKEKKGKNETEVIKKKTTVGAGDLTE